MASRRRNMFTGETLDEVSEKHNLKLDYAAMLQVQIREQNEKKEQLKLQKQEEQRREREEMDRMHSGKPSAKNSAPPPPNDPPRRAPSPEKRQQTHQTMNAPVPVPAPAQPVMLAPSPPRPMYPEQPSPMQASPAYRPSFTLPSVFGSSLPAATSIFPSRNTACPPQEIDAVQRLRHELEEARKQKLQVSKEMYQKPNFMLQMDPPKAHNVLPRPRSSHCMSNSNNNNSNNSNHAPSLDSPLAKEERRVVGFGTLTPRPSTPCLDMSSNQLESSSSFVSVVAGDRATPRGASLQAESCFVPFLGRALAEPQDAHHHVSDTKKKIQPSPFEGLEDSIDDIDAVLHAFLAKQR
ncbi:hypothetical protein SPRG_09394 [Saprolegnia parasitica CBS 223.65]|uniref:Uncharacterized protein n=1 Tax=Saprolegnia parasitica (strain CBS 223.65) TaxID=695850 RepID=A0A067CFW5_SAPPC|nr:hypothetical protein SPRG_09394 [Saprolegnia parasitica CBS 223.65]KDO25451.1 hypothetical protein SPRG_09394 [Saprolegnia parasitica CBS 223.65]|eukprot:XP_012203877.1 hypothetical protein SPRG_09394 [Saprolegnia parasitica CBS 223.65]